MRKKSEMRGNVGGEKKDGRDGAPQLVPIGRNYSVPYYTVLFTRRQLCSAVDEVHKYAYPREYIVMHISCIWETQDCMFAHTRWHVKFKYDFRNETKARQSRHRRYVHPIRTCRTRWGVVIDSEPPPCNTQRKNVYMLPAYFKRAKV